MIAGKLNFLRERAGVPPAGKHATERALKVETPA